MTNPDSSQPEQDQLEEQLINGLNSGPGIEADDAYWQRKQEDLVNRAKSGQDDSGA